jgi:hypothetical protein
MIEYRTGKSWEKSMVNVYVPSSQGVPLGPGISHSHLSILVVPSSLLSIGLATKPKG